MANKGPLYGPYNNIRDMYTMGDHLSIRHNRDYFYDLSDAFLPEIFMRASLFNPYIVIPYEHDSRFGKTIKEIITQDRIEFTEFYYDGTYNYSDRPPFQLTKEYKKEIIDYLNTYCLDDRTDFTQKEEALIASHVYNNEVAVTKIVNLFLMIRDKFTEKYNFDTDQAKKFQDFLLGFFLDKESGGFLGNAANYNLYLALDFEDGKIVENSVFSRHFNRLGQQMDALQKKYPQFDIYECFVRTSMGVALRCANDFALLADTIHAVYTKYPKNNLITPKMVNPDNKPVNLQNRNINNSIYDLFLGTISWIKHNDLELGPKLKENVDEACYTLIPSNGRTMIRDINRKLTDPTLIPGKTDIPSLEDFFSINQYMYNIAVGVNCMPEYAYSFARYMGQKVETDFAIDEKAPFLKELIKLNPALGKNIEPYSEEYRMEVRKKEKMLDKQAEEKYIRRDIKYNLRENKDNNKPNNNNSQEMEK